MPLQLGFLAKPAQTNKLSKSLILRENQTAANGGKRPRVAGCLVHVWSKKQESKDETAH
jgi:hypothetical protein